MSLIALRLLLVWFGTATLFLWLAHRFVRQLTVAVAVFLALLPFFVMGKALVTAGVFAPLDIAYQANPLASIAKEVGAESTLTPLLGDVVSLEIPWRKAVREAFKNRRLPLWNRFILAGEPLLAVQQPATLHPATWIGFLLPLAQAWTFEMAFGVLLAALSAYLFLREINLTEVPACLGGLLWALSDYLRFLAGYPQSSAAAGLPLLLLGLTRLARRPDRSGVAITIAALFLITSAGHPETLLHCVAAAGLYFLFELSARESRQRGRAILLALLAGALSLGLSAVILLPLKEALPHTFEFWMRSSWYAHIRKSAPFSESLRLLPELFVPYIHGSSGKGTYPTGLGASMAYAGALALPLAIVGLCSPRRERWALLGLIVLGIALWVRLPGITDVVSALPFFDITLNDRLAFLACFGIAALAAMGLEEIRARRNIRVFAWNSVFLLLCLSVVFVAVRPTLLGYGMPRWYLESRFAFQVVPLAVAAVLCFFPALRFRTRALAAALLGVSLLQRTGEISSLYPTFPNRAFYPPLALLDHIPRGKPERFTAVGYTFIPNMSAMYELEDVRGYEAMTFRPLVETFPLWCEPQAVWFNRIDDPTKPFLSFLNVRYFFAPPGFPVPSAWRLVSSDRSGEIMENPNALPRVFVPAWLRFENESTRQLQVLKSINDFGAYGVVADSTVQSPVGEQWRRNGTAHITQLDYRPPGFRMWVEADSDSVVGTSVSAWPGWRLLIDGKPTELIGYNRAFLAFRVTPGRHLVGLDYHPRSFVLGSIVSALSLCLSVLIIFFNPTLGLGTDARGSREPIGPN